MSEFVMSSVRAISRSVLLVLAGVVQAHAASLPDGKGRELVERVCTACHSSNQLTRSSGYSRDGWRALTATMVDLSADAHGHNEMLDYLAANFPPNTRRKAVLLEGPVRITFKEWVTPTLGQRSRDPVEIRLPNDASTVRRLDIASDGMICYVNSSQGRLGRYNPATEEITEWPSPSGPKSHPYAIAVIDGIVWYNESRVRPDALVRFDPSTQTFQSWAIPSGEVHAGIVRHMRPTRDGSLLIHQSSTNRIILVKIKEAM